MSEWLRNSLFGSFLVFTASLFISEDVRLAFMLDLVGVPLAFVFSWFYEKRREKQIQKKADFGHRVWLMGGVLKQDKVAPIKPADGRYPFFKERRRRAEK